MEEVTEREDSASGIALLLFQVGQNVRALRRDNSMTRRELAEAAGISERYLGQLENGQANVSLNILNRIIAYFGVPLGAVLPATGRLQTGLEPLGLLLSRLNRAEQEEALEILTERFGGVDRRRKGVALLGLRGAGKSTLGGMASDLLGKPFVRLSQLASERSGLDIASLMELSGQKGFRRFEYETLAHLVAMPGQVILEASGGIVDDPATYDLLLKHFFTVWIRAKPEDHMQRVISQRDLRPMTGRREAMRELIGFLDERAPNYARAEYVLDTSGRSPRDCLAELVNQAVSVFDPDEA